MKVWSYVIICMTLILMLQFAGLKTGLTPLGQLFKLTFNENNEITGFDVTFSEFFSYLFSEGIGSLLGILAGLGVGIAASFFIKGQAENFIILPFITTVLALFIQTFISVMVSVISEGVGWAAAIVSLIFVPLTIGYIVALLEFFRGTD